MYTSSNTWNKEMHHPIHIEPLSSLQVQVPIGHTFDQPRAAWKPLAATNTSYPLFPPLQGIHNFKLFTWPSCSFPASPCSWDRRTRAKARFVLFCRFLGGGKLTAKRPLSESLENVRALADGFRKAFIHLHSEHLLRHEGSSHNVSYNDGIFPLTKSARTGRYKIKMVCLSVPEALTRSALAGGVAFCAGKAW